LYAYATGTDGKDADEIAATTGIARTTWLIELPAGGGGTEGAATAATTTAVTAATAVTTTAVVVVLVLVLVLILLALVALLAVALLGAPLHPIDGAFGRCLFRAADGQRTPQRQGRHQSQEPTAGPGRRERTGQGIEGGRVHGSSCAGVGRYDRRTGQRFSFAVLRRTDCSSGAASRHRVCA